LGVLPVQFGGLADAGIIYGALSHHLAAAYTERDGLPVVALFARDLDSRAGGLLLGRISDAGDLVELLGTHPQLSLADRAVLLADYAAARVVP
jgi:hypothetical protein